MSLNTDITELKEAINEYSKKYRSEVSLLPSNLKSKQGQFSGVQTITINGPGELYSYYFRWGERTSVVIDGKVIDSGSYNNRMYNNCIDSSYGYYTYSSSTGWRSILTKNFTYGNKPGFVQPLRFNEKLEIKQGSGSGSNDYYYFVYSTFD